MSTIIAQNVPASVTDSKLKEFFSFCGKIDSIKEVDSDSTSKSYAVTFVSKDAISTAMLLNGAELESSQIHIDLPSTASRDAASEGVPGAAVSAAGAAAAQSVSESSEHDDIEQEDKPKSAILAEYLSQGYVLGDGIIDKAVKFDQEQGISEKFKNFLGGLDSKYHLSEKNEDLKNDPKVQNVSSNVQSTLDSTKRSWQSYLDKFKQDKYGSKIAEFYSKTVNDAADIHNEAKRLAELKKHQQTGITADSTTAQLAANVPLEEEKK